MDIDVGEIVEWDGVHTFHIWFSSPIGTLEYGQERPPRNQAKVSNPEHHRMWLQGNKHEMDIASEQVSHLNFLIFLSQRNK